MSSGRRSCDVRARGPTKPNRVELEHRNRNVRVWGATTDLVRGERLGPCVLPDAVDQVEEAVADLYHAYHAGAPLPCPSRAVRERYDGRRLTGCLDDLLRRAANHGNG